MNCEQEKGDHVLFVGEANFSLSLSIIRIWNSSSTNNVWASCFELDPVSELAKDNIRQLEDIGVNVILGVDATNLEHHFSEKKFAKIIFMFPHIGGKMRVEKNRQLLKQFAVSCQNHLVQQGQVIITLCKGQGGTPFDTVQRPQEKDTWQVVKMMAFGSFVLTNISNFDLKNNNSYKPFGYRSLDKAFNAENAVVHVFKKAPNWPSLNCTTLKEVVHEYLVHKFQKMLHDKKCALGQLLQERDPKPKSFSANIDDKPFLANSEGQIVFVFSSDNTLTVWLENVNLSKLACEQFNLECKQLWTETVSLYPPIYNHDLSFWLVNNYDSCDEKTLALIIKVVGRDCVVKYECLDTYIKGSRTSKTIRLTYQSENYALNPQNVMELHQEIGQAMETFMGVTIR